MSSQTCTPYLADLSPLEKTYDYVGEIEKTGTSLEKDKREYPQLVVKPHFDASVPFFPAADVSNITSQQCVMY